jgi:tetratricopeptide (TPR) repeat protein
MALQAEHAGDYLHALEYLDTALATDPNFADAWHAKGNCLDELGLCEDALYCYDQVLKIDPFDAETWYNKGLLLKRIGKEIEAFIYINRGIDLAIGR